LESWWEGWVTSASDDLTRLADIARKTGRKLYWNAAGEHFVGDPEAGTYLQREYREPWKLELH